jgi:fructose-bisphosphate aldolase class I
MVPIVEPEVLMDGSHNIEKCYKVTTDVLNECYNELEIHKVDLKGTVLKPNMVYLDLTCKDKSTSEEIAKKTLDCLKKMFQVMYLELHFYQVASLKRV